MSRSEQQEGQKKKRKYKVVRRLHAPDRFLLVVFGIGTAFQTHAQEHRSAPVDVTPRRRFGFGTKMHRQSKGNDRRNQPCAAKRTSGGSI